jgi:hypothetical protein
LNSCWEFWEPIRGRLTVINDDRYSLEYKTRANLAAAIPRAISIGLLTAANSGWRAHRTKKHQPARLSGGICRQGQQHKFPSTQTGRRQRLAIAGELRASDPMARLLLFSGQSRPSQ